MHVIFLAPHFPAGQRRFVQGLKNVGARVTGIGDAPVDRLPHDVRDMLDGYEYVRHIGDEEALFAAVQRIQARGPWVHHFEATIESHMLVAARVRERAGIPGLSYEVVERCRDKFLMKQFLRERGVPSARNAAVTTAADAKSFVQEVGFPVILKPRDGAGAHATYKLDDEGDLARALAETGLDRAERYFTMEEFIVGHEGFFDTLSINGRVVFEAISHYYPGVLEAMRDRSHSPYIVTTNRLDEEGYGELRAFGRKVITDLGIGTSATHMEWFFGPKGLSFSEIGARPPGVNFWDVYCQAAGFDLYTEWARAICWGDTWIPDVPRGCAGVLSIRPDRDGIVQGYSGMDEVQARWGQYIFKSHLPPVGSRTQGIEGGYLANAWVYARHPDYDGCRAMMDDIGRTLRMYAR